MQDLLGLPYQLLVDGIVSQLDTKSLLRLRQVSHSTKQLADDDLVWRRKLLTDFNFPILSSARVSGWQQLYRGLSNPELYTWGEYDRDRIGRKLIAGALPSHVWDVIIGIRAFRVRGVPFPLNIDWQGAQAQICGGESWANDDGASDNSVHEEFRPPSPGRLGVPIQLHAGGWSFYALTGTGQVLAWGGMPGMATESRNSLETPTLLDLHSRQVKTLTVGREHLVALIDNGNFLDWYRAFDRPIEIDVPYIFRDKPSDSVRVLQVEAGWDFTAALADMRESTSSSETPLSSRIVFWKTKWTELWRERYLIPKFRTERPGRYHPALLQMNAVTLPPLPSRATQIAAGDNFVLALTEDHLVYYISIPGTDGSIESQITTLLHSQQDEDHDAIDNEERTEMLEAKKGEIERLMNRIDSFFARMVRERQLYWRRLDNFCTELHSSGIKEDGKNIWDEEGFSHLFSSETTITHISAHFRNFAVYAPNAGSQSAGDKRKGIVILGHCDAASKAIVVPELQGIQVIKVTHGDYHSGALTQDGRVLTWGNQSNGALGSWDALPFSNDAHSTLQPSSETRSASSQFMARAFRPVRGVYRMFSPDNSSPATFEQRSEDSREVDQMVDAEKDRYFVRTLPDKVEKPLPVRFGFPRLGEEHEGRQVESTDRTETKHVFDIAFAGWHSGALAIDRSLLSLNETSSPTAS